MSQNHPAHPRKHLTTPTITKNTIVFRKCICYCKLLINSFSRIQKSHTHYTMVVKCFQNKGLNEYRVSIPHIKGCVSLLFHWKSIFVTNFRSTNSAAHSVCESIDQLKRPFQLGSRRKQTEQVPDVANATSAQRVSLKRPLGEGGVPHKRSL